MRRAGRRPAAGARDSTPRGRALSHRAGEPCVSGLDGGGDPHRPERTGPLGGDRRGAPPGGTGARRPRGHRPRRHALAPRPASRGVGRDYAYAGTKPGPMSRPGSRAGRIDRSRRAAPRKAFPNPGPPRRTTRFATLPAWLTLLKLRAQPLCPLLQRNTRHRSVRERGDAPSACGTASVSPAVVQARERGAFDLQRRAADDPEHHRAARRASPVGGLAIRRRQGARQAFSPRRAAHRREPANAARVDQRPMSGPESASTPRCTRPAPASPGGASRAGRRALTRRRSPSPRRAPAQTPRAQTFVRAVLVWTLGGDQRVEMRRDPPFWRTEHAARRSTPRPERMFTPVPAPPNVHPRPVREARPRPAQDSR